MSSPGVGKTTGCHLGISGYVHVDLGISVHIGGIFREDMVNTMASVALTAAMILAMQE